MRNDERRTYLNVNSHLSNLLIFFWFSGKETLVTIFNIDEEQMVKNEITIRRNGLTQFSTFRKRTTLLDQYDEWSSMSGFLVAHRHRNDSLYSS